MCFTTWAALLGWNVEKGILSVLFLLASASALFAVWGLYRDKRNCPLYPRG